LLAPPPTSKLEPTPYQLSAADYFREQE